MKERNSSKLSPLLPLALVILVIFFALCSGYGGLSTKYVEASVDAKKLGVSLDGDACFVYLADIESIELLSAVPSPISGEAAAYFSDSTQFCIAVRHKGGLLLFNLASNNKTEKLFTQLEKAVSQ